MGSGLLAESPWVILKDSMFVLLCFDTRCLKGLDSAVAILVIIL